MRLAPKHTLIMPFISIVLIIGLASCNGNSLYHKYKPIDTNGWSFNDTILFELSDSTIYNGQCYTDIELRHTENYQYRDLWLEISYPTGLNAETDSTYTIKYKTDTLHLYIANERGNWNSNGTTGGYYQFSTKGPDINLSKETKGKAVIKMNHIMKDSLLQSITDIGLHIKKR